MAIKLSKGQKIDLTKSSPGLKKITVALGWNTDPSVGTMDIDASVFLIGASGKVESENDFIYYNNPTGAGGAVIHSGDNRIGGASGDAEQINIDLPAVPNDIMRIAFAITIYDANARRQTFSKVSNAYVRIFNSETKEVILQYDLGQDFSVETAIVAAELYRHQGEWKFNAIGSGFKGGLAALCRNYGLDVEDESTSSSVMPYVQAPAPYVQTPAPYVQTPVPYSQGYVGEVVQTNSFGYQDQRVGGFACPRCGSNRITGGKKGFGIGKAAVGGLLLGPVGLLAGFIGSNKMEFMCVSCRYRWTPQENTGTMEWLEDQKRKTQELIARYRGKDMLEAVVAACALVAAADGVIQQSEREQMINYFRTSAEWRSMDIAQVVNRFDYYLAQLQYNNMIGRAEALRAVGTMRQKPEVARLIARLACAIGFADGEFCDVEKRVVEDICHELYLNPSEFIQ